MHFGHLLFPLQYAVDLDDPVIPKSAKKKKKKKEEKTN